MEHSLAQVPLLLGLGQLATCSSHGAQPPSSASPTRTRPPYSLLLYWSTASLKYLSHWDSTTRQLHPSKEHSFSQGSLPLGLDHLATCSTHGARPRSSVSPTGIRPPSSCIIPRNTASLKGLSHWDSTTLQLAPPKEHSLTQVPLPLGLGHLAVASSKEHIFSQGPLPLGFGHLAACSSHGAQPRSSVFPTRTRLPSNLLLP
ncbi:hypothetical protein Adt_03761 [Abeliophyllum distichum]|uniref:Uncharacterized protein n=1 Tax=Abeliophyllum distichum TaxID=126358 RepID=A0ABD1W1I1_9LAMI